MKGEYLKLETVKTIAELLNENKELRQEIERLNNIIKEVREYTELFRGCLDFDKDTRAVRLCKDILEILDKENK